MSTCEAVVRPKRSRTGTAQGKDETNKTGIHALHSSHTQRSDEHSNGQKGSGDGASAKQRRPGLWTEEEIVELRRLVGSNTDTRGKISWVEVEKGWRDLNLSERSKASLSAKWRDIKISTPTSQALEDQKESESAEAPTTHSGPPDIMVPTEAPADNDNPVGNNALSQPQDNSIAATDNTVLRKMPNLSSSKT